MLRRPKKVSDYWLAPNKISITMRPDRSIEVIQFTRYLHVVPPSGIENMEISTGIQLALTVLIG